MSDDMGALPKYSIGIALDSHHAPLHLSLAFGLTLSEIGTWPLVCVEAAHEPASRLSRHVRRP